MSNAGERKVSGEKESKAEGNLSGSVVWIFKEAAKEDEPRKVAG